MEIAALAAGKTLREGEGSKSMKTVLIFRSVCLRYSETFIREQILALSEWKAILIGLRHARALPLDGLDIKFLFNLPLGRACEALWMLMQTFGIFPFWVKQRLQKIPASLAHVHFGTDAVLFWPLLKSLGLPVIVTLHGYDINTYKEWWEKKRGFWFKKYPQRLLELASQPNVYFIAVSEAIKIRAVEFGIPPEKIAIQYIGIDCRKFTPAGRPITQRKRRLLFIGRMVENKGGKCLIEAFAIIRRKVPDAELVMIGNGPLSGILQKQAAELKVPIVFTGALSQAEVKNHIDCARVICLPSITAMNGTSEGFGMVLLEAQASGVPVVTSSKGGSKAGLIHGKTGFAFPEGDVAALAGFLMTLLTDDDVSASMSVEGSLFVAERYNIQRCTKELEDYYDEVAQK